MVLKLYGYPTAIGTRRIAVVARELGIPYTLIAIPPNTRGEDLPPSSSFDQKAQRPRSSSSSAQMPYIDDDGLIVYESRAICRYLATKANSSLIPTAATAPPQTVAAFERAMEEELRGFSNTVSGIVWETSLKRTYHRQDPDERVVRSLIRVLNQKLDVYESVLRRTRYLTGNDLRLVDIFHLPDGAYLFKLGINVLCDPSRPNVFRWWMEISSRESWKVVKNSA